MNPTCSDCGRECIPSGCTTGYGKIVENGEEKVVCFECCGVRDRNRLRDSKPGDKEVLYLNFKTETYQPTPGQKERGFGVGRAYTNCFVSNWPGTMKFPCYLRRGKHNAGVRYDVWFCDHAGGWWQGTQYGDQTQICHCKKLKYPPYALGWLKPATEGEMLKQMILREKQT